MVKRAGDSVSVSAQDGIVALGKAHMRSAPSLSSLPKVALETVPIFVWLNTDRSRPWRVECRPLPFSTPLSFRRSMLWCSGLSVLRKFLKPLSTSALPSCRPDVISAVIQESNPTSPSLVLSVTKTLGTPVAILPRAWCYRVNPRKGGSRVKILWLSEMASLIWNSYLSVAVCKLVLADLTRGAPSLLLRH